jgi:hypothetical protein
MMPLAPDVSPQQRQSTLALLLARIQANDTRSTAKVREPIPVVPPAVAEPAPAQEKISAFDDRWGQPQKPPPVAAAPPKAAVPAGDRGARLQSILARIQQAGRRSS